MIDLKKTGIMYIATNWLIGINANNKVKVIPFVINKNKNKIQTLLDNQLINGDFRSLNRKYNSLLEKFDLAPINFVLNLSDFDKAQEAINSCVLKALNVFSYHFAGILTYNQVVQLKLVAEQIIEQKLKDEIEDLNEKINQQFNEF